jgi:hypothetical protein
MIYNNGYNIINCGIHISIIESFMCSNSIKARYLHFVSPFGEKDISCAITDRLRTTFFIYKAGIRSENLKLVLEPEAASLYCKTLDESEIHVISGTKRDNPLARGKRYILLDLGG